MLAHRNAQYAETIAHAAGEFFAREAGKESLITVTRAIVSTDLKRADIFISVLPEAAEEKALAFAKRERTELLRFVREKGGIYRVPTLDVLIDYGEKNRRQVEEALGR